MTDTIQQALQTIGLTSDELQARVVDKLADQLGAYIDGEGLLAQAEARIRKQVKPRIDAAVTAVADAQLTPHIDELIASVTLQETNKWGEKRGESLTFVEYITHRAKCYMIEEVDHDGRSQLEARDRGNSWRKTQTRIAHAVDKYLRYQIERAMKKILADANSTLAKGLGDAVQIKLAELAKAVTVNVKTG